MERLEQVEGLHNLEFRRADGQVSRKMYGRSPDKEECKRKTSFLMRTGGLLAFFPKRAVARWKSDKAFLGRWAGRKLIL